MLKSKVLPSILLFLREFNFFYHKMSDSSSSYHTYSPQFYQENEGEEEKQPQSALQSCNQSLYCQMKQKLDKKKKEKSEKKKVQKNKRSRHPHPHPLANWAAGFCLFYGLWGLLDDVKTHTIDGKKRESFQDTVWYGSIAALGVGIVACEPGKFVKNFEEV